MGYWHHISDQSGIINLDGDIHSRKLFVFMFAVLNVGGFIGETHNWGFAMSL